MLHLVGCTLFANKIVTHVHVIFLDAFRDLMQSGSYAWGGATLVHMYDNLNDASKGTVKQLVEYITLLQVILIFFSSLVYIEYYFHCFVVFKICAVLDLRTLSFCCFFYCCPRLS